MDTRLSALNPQVSLSSAPDPADWDDTRLPLLNPLDSALRCDICKDFYNSPVITNCSHTFCSVCIRRALHADKICPICRTTEQEYRLRKNPVVQELVDAFLSARPKLLEVARDVVPVMLVSRAAGEPGTREGEEEEEEEEEEKEGRAIELSDGGPPAKRPRSASRTTRSMGSAPRYAEKHSADVAEIPTPGDDLVSCPSCQKRIKIDAMNPHLDRCLAEDEYKPPSRSSLSVRNYSTRSSKNASSTPPTPPQPLPKITYSFLKDNALRNKLAELGIPSHGARKLLQERHSEWMTIWNANVDANQPRRKNELLADLASWERAHLRPSNQPAKAQWSDDQWKIKHEDQFDTLIADVKARAAAAKKMKEDDAAKEAAQKRTNGGTSLVGGAGVGSYDSYDSSEKLKDVNSTAEVQSTPPVQAVPKLSVDVLSDHAVSMTMIEPYLGFDIVAPHMDERSWGQDSSRITADSRDFSSHNGKRKYNEIDGAPITEALQSRFHK